MATLLTLPVNVPLPLLMVQVWPDGAELMLSVQALPLAMASVKVTAPLVAPPSLKNTPSLYSSQIMLPEAPETVPLMLYVVGPTTMSEQVIETVVTLAVREPLPLLIAQV